MRRSKWEYIPVRIICKYCTLDAAIDMVVGSAYMPTGTKSINCYGHARRITCPQYGSERQRVCKEVIIIVKVTKIAISVDSAVTIMIDHERESCASVETSRRNLIRYTFEIRVTG